MDAEEQQRQGQQAHEALEELASALVGMLITDARELCHDLGLNFRVIDWDVIKGRGSHVGLPL